MTLFAGWLVVVGLATTLTWQIVSAADDQVSERPIAPLNVAAPVITGGDTTTTTSTIVVPTTVSPTTTTSTPVTSSTAAGTGATTSSTPVTTQPAPTTTTPSWLTRSVQTAGGNVILRYRPGEVSYQSATPAPGFQVEVDKAGPPEVKVEFESETQKVEVEASWSEGDLDVHVSEESEGSDD